MATTCEPARVVDPTSNPANASPRLLAVPGLDDHAAPPYLDPMSDPSAGSNPPPNPPFVFPARDPASAPPSFSRASGRRPQSVIETNKLPGVVAGVEAVHSSRPSLPAFSFNPGASTSQNDTGFLSPPLSPQLAGAVSSSSRPGGYGHRRGGSEYVGGSIRGGDSIMSINPLPGDAPTGPLPPTNRRGRHAHRRSAALSSHDLSIVLHPPNGDSAARRGGSAPTSPAIFNPKDAPALPSPPLLPNPAEPQQSIEDSVRADSSHTSRGLVKPVFEADKSPINRVRVGFSETVEFIPRPLSMISNDTSSTVTAKPSHSVSGSISSLMSGHPPAVAGKTSLDEAPQIHAREKAGSPTGSRPSTAGAVLERTPSTLDTNANQSSPRRRNSIPALVQTSDAAVDSPEPSPSKPPKRWSFFGLDPFTSSQQTRSRAVSSSSTESVAHKDMPSECLFNDDSNIQATKTLRPSTPRKRKGKKPTKKVKTWAGSILTRKSKPRAKSKTSRPSSANLDDSDNRTFVMREGQHLDEIAAPNTPEITIMLEGSTSEIPARRVSLEEDSSYQMIDLDAALGPFNTPLPHNPEWEAAQRAAGNTKRRLHSAQKLRGFSGPGMHYHRRTESAPEMVPFEDARFGMHRFGSNSTMADVFEEDEEDEEDDETSSSTSESEGENECDKEASSHSEPSKEMTPTPETPRKLPLPINTGISSQTVTRRRSSGWSDIRDSQSAILERSVSSSREDAGDEVQFRTSNIFQGSGSPANSATPSPRRILAARDLAPVDVSPLQLPAVAHAPVSPYSMSYGSSFPSPRSPISVDAQRISTAPSSVNEETSFQSLLLGQPGPEVRISADDVPSLASTNSTMTRDDAVTPNTHQQQSLPKPRPQRPASVSTAFGRRRSSLASLSRLISSSHGERSKLSMEVPLDDEPDKKTKTKKTRRLSRLVQFWKGKEGDSD